jgi:DNA-binding NarL/FixJ family response regulator
MTMMNGTSGARIMIVDDHKSIRDLVRLVFELDGFTVVGEAADGLEAVSLGQELHPDVVILDYEMPYQDGAATAAVLRERCPEARIVAFSGVLESKPEWADAYLRKTEVEDLTDVVITLP